MRLSNTVELTFHPLLQHISACLGLPVSHVVIVVKQYHDELDRLDRESERERELANGHISMVQ